MLKSTVREFRGVLRRRRVARSERASALDRILETNTVFVHVPKCGGKSVVHDIYELCEHMWFGHAGISFYHSLLGPRRFWSAFKFAFVRDPVSRCLSGFKFRKRGGFGLPSDKAILPEIKGLSFEQFVMDGKLAEAKQSDIVFRPQMPFLLLPDGQLGVDRVCFFEKFSEEMRSLPIKLRGGTISHKNAAPHCSRDEVPPKVVDKITDIYEQDYKFIAGLAA